MTTDRGPSPQRRKQHQTRALYLPWISMRIRLNALLEDSLTMWATMGALEPPGPSCQEDRPPGQRTVGSSIHQDHRCSVALDPEEEAYENRVVVRKVRRRAPPNVLSEFAVLSASSSRCSCSRSKSDARLTGFPGSLDVRVAGSSILRSTHNQEWRAPGGGCDGDGLGAPCWFGPEA